MATLKIMHGRDVVQRLDLIDQKEVSIGRNDKADVILDNVLVSRMHAKIGNAGGEWVILDASNSNGLLINGKKVKRKPLRDKDEIQIGKYSLVFNQRIDELERDIAQASSKPGADFKTSFTDLLQDQKIVPQNELLTQTHSNVDITEETMRLAPDHLENIRKKMSTRRSPHLVALSIMDKTTYPLDKARVTIGKGIDATIRVKGGFTIAKVQTLLFPENGHWFIEHLAGLSKTKVNGSRISKQLLHEGDKIEVGDFKFKFMDYVK